jgi:potassium-dependent mechanosensitive channel
MIRKIIIISTLFGGLLSNMIAQASNNHDNGTHYLLDIANKLLFFLSSMWHYPLLRMEGQPVALSNFITGIFLLIVGLRVAKYLSNLVHSKLLKIISLDSSVSHALWRISYYAFIIIIVLLVLEISHVPLTIFTFIGGALAISVGVGGQHVLNNFMSGLVVMIESPIKVGDIIEFGDAIGRVQSINARCIDIRTNENKSILIPHSSILQNNLINWTANDYNIRLNTQISVNQYAATPQELEKIIINAISENKDILNYPKPLFYLTKFDDNIMNFEINFWVNLSKIMERKQVISDINIIIEQTLRKENIPLATQNRKISN